MTTNARKDYLYDKMRPIYIPEISDAEIAEMRYIEPLLPDNGCYRRIEGQEKIHPRNVSFIWDAKPTGNQMAFSPLNEAVIMSFHSFGAPVLFKPSLAEVYAAIRRFCESWEDVHYFSLDSNLGPENVIGCCHWTRCRLLGKEFIDVE